MADDEARRQSAARALPQEPLKPTPPSQSSTNLARSGTLSWQQRPTSRGSPSNRSRPLSLVGPSQKTIRSPEPTPEPPTAEEKESSRAQIAQSLGGKDPSWFRQTADRGQGSAALRKNEDNTSDSASKVDSVQLHGLSRRSTADAEPEQSSMPRYSSYRTGAPDATASGLRSSPQPPARSPLPTMSSQVFEPPKQPASSIPNENDPVQEPAANQTLGPLSPERTTRPVSPTKGLGGFVQSAMMKRSDSVSKRWSAQAGSNLNRSNSTVSNKGVTEKPTPPSTTNSQFGSAKLTSPEAVEAASQSTAEAVSLDYNPTNQSNQAKAIDSGAEQLKSLKITPSSTTAPIEELQASPTKRWSPIKSSWLENALNKPDAPKFRATPPPQPSWMADINRAKQNRGSVDLGKNQSHQEVTTGGLLRSPPMGSVPKSASLEFMSIAKTSSRPTSPTKETPLRQVETDVETRSPSPELETVPELTKTPQSVSVSTFKNTTASKPPILSPKPSISRSEKPTSVSQRRSPSITGSAKADTPPKKDFRAGLRPTGANAGQAKPETVEFKNVFGSLRRTETKNYVAPDVLKGNILRGKAGLNVTGGPKRTERVDEFKESILKKKAAMKTGETSTSKGSAPVPAPMLEAVIPEALAKRRDMSGKPSVVQSPPQAPAQEATLPPTQNPSIHSFSKTQKATDKVDVIRTPAVTPANNDAGGGFNAMLAGILSRGPPASAPAASTSTAPSRDESPSPVKSGSKEGPELQHATKGRARGPKRRLPTSTSETSKKTESIASPSASMSEEKPGEERPLRQASQFCRRNRSSKPRPGHQKSRRRRRTIGRRSKPLSHIEPNQTPSRAPRLTSLHRQYTQALLRRNLP